ncbi:MAG: peptidoglycan recognition family protein [Burkholderiales bacterium]
MKTVCALIGVALAFGPAEEAAARRTGGQRGTAIDMIVIHSTGGPKCDERTNEVVWIRGGELNANMRFIEAHPTLGIHYMIDRDGTLRKSVPEHQLAHHVKGYSERSISIELVNDGDGKEPFPPAQLDAAIELVRDISQRRGILRTNVKRHSDLDRAVLPCYPNQRRKVDPGPAFPYEQVLDAVYKAQ